MKICALVRYFGSSVDFFNERAEISLFVKFKKKIFKYFLLTVIVLEDINEILMIVFEYE